MNRIFNISLDSDIALPELPVIEGAGHSITVQAAQESFRQTLNPRWFHDWLDSRGKKQIICGHIEGGYLLEFPGLVEFAITQAGKQVKYFVQKDAPEETTRHLLLDQIIPRMLGQQGQLVLHTSAVILPTGQGIAFFGHTGWGKSTLASSFHAAGAQLITDDCLLVNVTEAGDVRGIPNYYGLRLYRDSAEAIFNQHEDFTAVAHYSAKRRLILHDQEAKSSDQGTPLSAIFLLSDPEGSRLNSDVVIEQVKGAGELMAMVEQMFVLDVTDKNLMAQQFKNMGNVLSAGMPVYRVQYPRDHSLLPAVRDAITGVI